MAIVLLFIITYSLSGLPTYEVSTNALANLISLDQSNEPEFLFLGSGDSLFLKEQLFLSLDKPTNLALEFKANQNIKGYINAEAILYIHTDTSLTFTDGSISEIYYDPLKKQSIIHFDQATYFSLSPGAATIITSQEHIETTNIDIFTYPNPSKGFSTVTIKGNIQERIMVEILDNKGKLIDVRPFTIFPGSNDIPVDLSYFPKGLYTVSLRGKHLSKTLRISYF